MNFSATYMILADVFPIDGTKQGKLAHLVVGALFAWFFWYVLEKQYRHSMPNPFIFFLACLWGACGIFFFRWFLVDFKIPILGSKWFYAAFPDWDELILGRGAHRNLIFHSTIIPISLMMIAVWKKIPLLRDFGIGLTLGVSAHLLWDLITVYRYPWHYIRHLDGYAGAFWVMANVGIGLFLAYYLSGRTALPIKEREAEPMI